MADSKIKQEKTLWIKKNEPNAITHLVRLDNFSNIVEKQIFFSVCAL